MINLVTINIKGINDRARADKIKKTIADCLTTNKIKKTIADCLTTNLTGDELSNVSVNVSVNITIKNR